MQFELKTKVAQDFKQVFAGFDAELFAKLTPPLTKVRLLQFDGCKKGDIVSLELTMFWLLRQKWTSHITDAAESDEEIYFIDESEGKDLPFFLSKWRHQHRIIRDAESGGAIIVDNITYRAPFGLNWLLRPVLWLQFAYRRPIYRRTFALKKP
jgi:ligand-binding SRPBCC domain-containing protein